MVTSSSKHITTGPVRSCPWGYRNCTWGAPSLFHLKSRLQSMVVNAVDDVVVVKCRPLTAKERQRSRDIVRVLDDKDVIILDPDQSKDYLDRVQNRTKEKKYCFDYAYGPGSANLDVYKKSISSTIAGVIQGLNATVFAYGSTGSGKTYTMVGTQDDPGLMVLSLHTIFDLINSDDSSDSFEVTCSYLVSILEVYMVMFYIFKFLKY